MKAKRVSASVTMGFHVEGLNVKTVTYVDSKGVTETMYQVYNKTAKGNVKEEIKDNAKNLVVELFKETPQHDKVKRAAEFLAQEFRTDEEESQTP